jgi:hypothetical protein
MIQVIRNQMVTYTPFANNIFCLLVVLGIGFRTLQDFACIECSLYHLTTSPKQITLYGLTCLAFKTSKQVNKTFALYTK